MTRTRERLILAAILATILATRLIRLDQPIVENYVGRQLPTAMVARNLMSDGPAGFLDPKLDTGPFPNRFLVEPPIYASASAIVSARTGWPLSSSGRAVSAIATVLAAWGIAGLTRARSGPAAGLLAALAFGIMPISLRYGRAFQPDMLAIGLVLAGLNLWERGRRFGKVIGWITLATGLATKIISIFALVPTWLDGLGMAGSLLSVSLPNREGGLGGGGVVSKPQPCDRLTQLGRRPGRSILHIGLTLIPALIWYVYASTRFSDGSRASADSAAIWAWALLPTALLDPKIWAVAARYLIYRSFTPVLTGLALWALIRRRIPRYWNAWGIAAIAMLAWLSGKSHQEYYWIALAPAVAVGASLGLLDLADRGRSGRLAAGLTGVLAMGLGVAQSLPTWSTPPEWAMIGRAASAIHNVDPRSTSLDLIVAREAVLFESGRRGYRLESEPASARRAAGEFGRRLPDGEDPGAALVKLYRDRGAVLFADVGDPARGRLRGPLHESIRARYSPIYTDEPGLLVVGLRARPTADR